MNAGTKNKLMTWLLLLLLVANAATITLFWLGRKKQPPQPNRSPKEFLIKELKLDARQQEQFALLVKEHRDGAEQLRVKIKKAKEAFFDLLGANGVTDSIKQAAAKQVSVQTEQLDLFTLDHFQKVRALCTGEQQKIFDGIIKEVIGMMGQQRPPGDERPPPGE